MVVVAIFANNTFKHKTKLRVSGNKGVTNLSKKKSFVIAGLIIVLGILISSFFSNQKKPIQRKPGVQKVRELNTIIVNNESIVFQFDISGTLYSRDKIDMFAEVSGVLEEGNKRFKEGVYFDKGEVVFHINDDVYRNNVLAQKSSFLNQLTQLLPDLEIDFPESIDKWHSYLNQFEFDESLKPLPEAANSRERNYLAARNIYNIFYTVKSMEATLGKYTVLAPFNGLVTESNLNPGMLVMNGQRLGEFTSTGIFELEASVNLAEVRNVKRGQNVKLISDDIPGEFEGVVERVNNKIDQASQTVKVYITTTDNRLKDGMYLTAHVTTDAFENAIKIPHRLLDGDRIYALADSSVISYKVEIVGTENGDVIVTGLADGVVLLDEGIKDVVDGTKLSEIALD